MPEVGVCTILYVEDDPDDTLLFERAFSRAVIPCALHCVDSADEARCYLLGQERYSDRERFPLPDLLITDLTLNAKSAVAFIRWVQSQPALANVVIACLTGSDDPHKLHELTDLGISIIRKTAVFEDALEVIRKLLFS